MGNKYSNEYIPKDNFDNIASRQYKPNELELLNAKLKKMEEAIEYNIKIDDDIDIDLNLKNNFTKKYGLYLGIKRFAIPIIGVISSGKSTFMNKILNLKNILETNDKVTTKFITIIRHDKNVEIPEVYQVEIERRNKGKTTDRFNFIEKGENLLKSKDNTSIEKIIKDLNEDIKKSNSEKSQKYLKDIEKYFLIVKTKIPIFEGEFEEYGDLIDFLDIPGLDEVKDNINSTESVFNDFIPMIFSNILFPIFIADVKTLETENPKNILKNFFNLYAEKTKLLNSKNNEIEYDKGIYLLNKMDLKNKDKKEDIFNTFFQNFGTIDLGNQITIKIPLEENKNFFGIIATRLFQEKVGSFVEDELDEIISQSKDSQKNSFKSFIKEYLLKKYEIDLNKAKEEKEDFSLKERLNIVNDKLKKGCKSLNNPKLDLKEYTYLSKIKFNNNETDVEYNNNMFFKIQKKIRDELDSFLYFNFEGLIEYIDKNNLEEKKNFSHKRLYDKNFLLNFNQKILSLFSNTLLKQFDNIKEIINQVENFSTFYNNRNVRIIFIGIISSGKTSLLNSIIGNHTNILQTTHKECTKCIYRIKYSKKISFCESEIKNNKNYGHYFEDIIGTSIYDVEEIKKKIERLNEEKSFKYFTLYAPIEGLESVENKENIELIDLPGLTKDNESEFNLRQLFNMSDGFIFSFNSLSIADENSHLIFDKIIKYIKDRVDGFNFKNCLFHLNYIDEIEEDSIPEKIKEFKDLIMKTINEKIYTGTFVEKMALKDNILASDDINVSYISNTFYEQYQENVEKIQSLKFITNDNLKNIYEDFILEEYDESQIEELISKNSLEKKYNKELQEKILLIKQKSSDNNDAYVLKIAKFLIIFEKYKNILIKKYESSKAEFFFQQFNNQIKLAKENNNINLNNKICYYITTLLFNLSYYNELCLDEEKIIYYKDKIKIKKKS